MNQKLSSLAVKWPSSFVSRDQVEKFSGGIMTSGYLANLDSVGLGPKERIRIGRKIAYPVNSLIDWLETRITQA